LDYLGFLQSGSESTSIVQHRAALNNEIS
jgi:hypothetical protein